MKLSKHHGLGNDFLVVLDEGNTSAVHIDSDWVRQMCDRRSGIGADGLIHGAAVGGGSTADVAMHLWNADGSRAEMSGNGIRCLAQALARSRGVGEATILADTDAGLRTLEVAAGAVAGEAWVRVDMGEVGPGPGAEGLLLPVAAKEFATADLGNPHLVIWVDDPTAVDLATVGPEIESQFPDGINVEVIAIGSDPATVRLWVWERGVGITQACGTGACAAAALARRWGMVDSRVVRVDMPGGSVGVELIDGRAVLSGPAVHIADLQVPAPEATDRG